MRHRRWIIGAGLALPLVVAAAGYWVLQPSPGLTITNCKRLHDGMTLAEVESALGQPRVVEHARGEEPVFWFATWESERLRVEIMFSMEDVALEGCWQEWYDEGRSDGILHYMPPRPGVWRRIFSWLER
jgi:hypothetical protein